MCPFWLGCSITRAILTLCYSPLGHFHTCVTYSHPLVLLWYIMVLFLASAPVSSQLNTWTLLNRFINSSFLFLISDVEFICLILGMKKSVEAWIVYFFMSEVYRSCQDLLINFSLSLPLNCSLCKLLRRYHRSTLLLVCVLVL